MRAIDPVDDQSTVILAQGAHVRYRVFEDGATESRGAFARLRPRQSVEVHALRGIDLVVRRGEAVGVIGSNGSGKSTLLRAIAGLQTVADGSIRVRGDVGLLGVGAALKTTLSGHRNIMLGGLAMGLSRDEVEASIPGIIQFTDLGDAIRRPLNTYSSGMRARLAFAIATLRTPEILLIDEALAVGDRAFREKSLARINEIRDQAGTILMVTHNLNEIRQTCSRTIRLEDGHVLCDGETEDVLMKYEAASIE